MWARLVVRAGLCPTQGHTAVPCRAGPHSEAAQVPAQWPEGGPHGARHTRRAPFPSVLLLSGPWIQLSRGSQGSRRARNQMGRGKEGFGPEWGFSPPFPHPHPPSAKAWGCQLQPEMGVEGGAGGRSHVSSVQEGGGEDPGLPVPPHTHTPLVFSLSLLGLRAGSPGAVVSEVDRAALSFLPSGGRGGAGGGTGSDAPSPPPMP